MVATGARLKAHAEPARLYRPPITSESSDPTCEQDTTAVDARDLA